MRVLLLLAAVTVWAQSGCFVGNRGQQICYNVGDLTKTTADALVNAANSQLSHGGGIAGAVSVQKENKKRIIQFFFLFFFLFCWQLSVACGPQLQMASDAIVAAGGSIPVSETAGKYRFNRKKKLADFSIVDLADAVTSSYNLANLARDIIHVVGPQYDPNRDAYMRVLLRDAVWNVLRTARLACDFSVAIPPISSNIFGFPLQAATDVIMDAISDFYLYVYDQPDGVLPASVVTQGLGYARFIDRSPCANALVPANVTVVAWANRDMEAGAVQASFDRVSGSEAARRKRLGLSSSAQYSVAATTTLPTTTTTTGATTATVADTTTTNPSSSSPSGSSPSSDASSMTSAASGTSVRHSPSGTGASDQASTTSKNDSNSMASDPAGLDYCGPLPVPCWSIALFVGLLLCCIGLMGASAWLCMRNRGDNRYRQLDEPVSSRR